MQGRRKHFYGMGGRGGGGLVKMSATMVDRQRKIKKKKHWLKRPKAGPQKTKLGPKYK